MRGRWVGSSSGEVIPNDSAPIPALELRETWIPRSGAGRERARRVDTQRQSGARLTSAGSNQRHSSRPSGCRTIPIRRPCCCGRAIPTFAGSDPQPVQKPDPPTGDVPQRLDNTKRERCLVCKGSGGRAGWRMAADQGTRSPHACVARMPSFVRQAGLMFHASPRRPAVAQPPRSAHPLELHRSRGVPVCTQTARRTRCRVW